MKKKLAIILCFFMAIGSFANESVENIESKNSRQKEIQLKFGMMPFPELFLCAVAHPHPSMVFSPVVTGEYLYYLNPNIRTGGLLRVGKRKKSDSGSFPKMRSAARPSSLRSGV
mgnify:CR=1 FL=1